MNSSQTITTDFSAIRIGIVCPMANEAATAASFVDALLRECAKFGFASVSLFAVVDRVSRDDTRAVLEAEAAVHPELHVIWAPETRGVADAYVRGYREALAAGSDWVLEIDAGHSHDPADIGRFLEAMATGFDCVFGSRFMSGGHNSGSLRRHVVSRGGTVLTNLALGTTLTDMTSGFQLFSRSALEDVLAKGILSKGPFFQTEIKTHCRKLRIVEVPINYSGASHVVGRKAVTEALGALSVLLRRRLAGKL